MPDRDAFMRAIRERPDDDGPRLVYADWLEEQGDPRGEFIRIQCELAQLKPWDPRRPALEEREADLLAVHDYEWLGRPPRWVTDWEFKRGFVQRFCGTQPSLSELEPLLDSSVSPTAEFAVSLRNVPAAESLLWVLDSPHLEVLGGIDWVVPITYLENRELVTFLSSPRLAGVRSLGLRASMDRALLLETLDQRPGAEVLEELRITDLPRTSDVERFLQCRRLNSIVSLTVQNRIDVSFVRDIGAAPFRWRKLDLGPRRFAADDLMGLAECQRLHELHVNLLNDLTLRLPPCLRRLQINVDAPSPLLATLPHLPVLASLEWLHIRIDRDVQSEDPNEVSRLGDLLRRLRGPVLHLEAVSHGLSLGDLARLPAQDRISKLFFDCDDIADDDMRLLVERGELTGLQAFHLYCDRLSPRHLELLTKYPFPPSLRRLSIRSALADDAALANFIGVESFKRLTQLDLRGCYVGPKTLAALFNAAFFPHLRSLWLPPGATSTKTVWESFRRMPGLSPLFRLNGR